jgi:hypothetical protein
MPVNTSRTPRSAQPQGSAKGDTCTNGPAVIAAGMVFTVPALIATLPYLTRNSILREIRCGRLRASRRCGRYLVLGEWVLRWVADGERRRREPESNGMAATVAD